VHSAVFTETTQLTYASVDSSNAGWDEGGAGQQLQQHCAKEPANSSGTL